jgi:hypothetical protein
MGLSQTSQCIVGGPTIARRVSAPVSPAPTTSAAATAVRTTCTGACVVPSSELLFPQCSLSRSSPSTHVSLHCPPCRSWEPQISNLPQHPHSELLTTLQGVARHENSRRSCSWDRPLDTVETVMRDHLTRIALQVRGPGTSTFIFRHAVKRLWQCCWHLQRRRR